MEFLFGYLLVCLVILILSVYGALIRGSDLTVSELILAIFASILPVLNLIFLYDFYLKDRIKFKGLWNIVLIKGKKRV